MTTDPTTTEPAAPGSDETPLEEARRWARHGYEIGQRSCTWSDHGVAPKWLTGGWPLDAFTEPAAPAALDDEDAEFPPNTVKVFTDYDEDPLRVWLDGDVLVVKANSVHVPVAQLAGVLSRIAAVASAPAALDETGTGAITTATKGTTMPEDLTVTLTPQQQDLIGDALASMLAGRKRAEGRHAEVEDLCRKTGLYVLNLG